MSQRKIEVMGRAAARHGEWIWGSAGLGAAGVSSCFAAYMLVVGPSDTGFRGAGDFGLFARMHPSTRVVTNPIVPTGATRTAAVDFAPTGTVAVATDGAAAGDTASRTPAARSSDRVLASFILRDVFDGRALVESPSTLTLVSKGSVLDGAGTVLAIERQGTGWQVVTSRGIIGGVR